MSIYEYNEEYVRKSFFQDGDASRLIKSVEAAMEHFQVDLQTACTGLGTTVAEYRKAKESSS